MDVQKKLERIVATVAGARSMPMSASCVVNRAELLTLLEEVRAALPGSLAQAQELLGDREQTIAHARQEADRIIESAHAERGTLISDTEVARRAQAEADRILAEARREAEETRAEADEYVDSKLANFEVVLTKTLGSVGRGREKLLGTGPGVDEQGYADEDAPERSQDPQTLRRNADAYVDVKLGAFEAVLAKTLEAVGRGREKLHGRIASDDLGALALNEDGTPAQHTSDAEFLADLAEAGQIGQAVQSGRQPYGEQRSAYAYQQHQLHQQHQQEPAGDAHAYQQPYGTQDPYGYQHADPYADYARQQGYEQLGAYDQDQDQGYGQAQDDRHIPVQRQPKALDETSFFDTTMISAEQLRAYEQGR